MYGAVTATDQKRVSLDARKGNDVVGFSATSLASTALEIVRRRRTEKEQQPMNCMRWTKRYEYDNETDETAFPPFLPSLHRRRPLSKLHQNAVRNVRDEGWGA
jgi:hypothetical protein